MTGSFSMPNRNAGSGSGSSFGIPFLHTPESVANILGAPKGGGRKDPGQGIGRLGAGASLNSCPSEMIPSEPCMP